MRMLVNMNHLEGSTSQRHLGWVETETNCVGGGGAEGGDSRHEARDNTYLDFSFQDKVCITRICETKNSAKLLRSEVTDVANFEFGGLAHDPRQR